MFQSEIIFWDVSYVRCGNSNVMKRLIRIGYLFIYSSSFHPLTVIPGGDGTVPWGGDDTCVIT